MLPAGTFRLQNFSSIYHPLYTRITLQKDTRARAVSIRFVDARQQGNFFFFSPAEYIFFLKKRKNREEGKVKKGAACTASGSSLATATDWINNHKAFHILKKKGGARTEEFPLCFENSSPRNNNPAQKSSIGKIRRRHIYKTLFGEAEISGRPKMKDKNRTTTLSPLSAPPSFPSLTDWFKLRLLLLQLKNKEERAPACWMQSDLALPRRSLGAIAYHLCFLLFLFSFCRQQSGLSLLAPYGPTLVLQKYGEERERERKSYTLPFTLVSGDERLFFKNLWPFPPVYPVKWSVGAVAIRECPALNHNAPALCLYLFQTSGK